MPALLIRQFLPILRLWTRCPGALGKSPKTQLQRTTEPRPFRERPFPTTPIRWPAIVPLLTLELRMQYHSPVKGAICFDP